MSLEIRENVDLAPWTTFGIRSIARYFCEVSSIEALEAALSFAKAGALATFILGAGSNILVSDEGFSGLVIRMAMKGVSFEEQADGSTLLFAEAGADMDVLVAESCRRNLGGLEALSGIPSSLGGAIVQNMGAYGQEISESLIAVELMDLDRGERAELSVSELDFAYRKSRLKAPSNRLCVTRAILRLQPFEAELARKRCVERGFARLTQAPFQTAESLRAKVIETRQAKGMCYDALDSDTHGVGSFFVNPIVSNSEAERLNAACILRKHRPMPKFPVEQGTKLSAAWLIEESGFSKGYVFGRTGLSSKHCLALVNRGGASSREICQFAEMIVQRVFQQFKVVLEPELLYLDREGQRQLIFNTGRIA